VNRQTFEWALIFAFPAVVWFGIGFALGWWAGS
jgi:hypothetical protein